MFKMFRRAPDADWPAPSWKRHGDVTIHVSPAVFAGGELVQNAVVDGDVLFKFAGPISGYVPLAALGYIEKNLREVHGKTTWTTRVLPPLDDSIPPPPPPEKLDRLFRLTHEESIARSQRISDLPSWKLGVAISDTEMDLARWRTTLAMRPEMTPEERGQLALQALESMEARFRIWIDREVEVL